MYDTLNNLNNYEVKVVFCSSKSRFYEETVSNAKQMLNYSETTKNGILKHILVLKKFPKQDKEQYIRDFLILAKIVDRHASNWKGFQIFYNGIEGSKKRLINAYHCYMDCLEEIDQIKFCTRNNTCPFVCQWCHIFITSCISKQDDFDCYECEHNITPYGYFKKDGSFHIDKEFLADDLQKELSKVALCPLLDINKLKDSINDFPAIINPKIDKNWEYDVNERNKIIGVIKKRYFPHRTYDDTAPKLDELDCELLELDWSEIMKGIDNDR